MINNDLYLLDAHCDCFEMRNFLNHSFDLTKQTYLISKEMQIFLKNTFKEDTKNLSETHTYQTTLKGLQQGNVKIIFINVAYYDLFTSSKIIDGVYNFVEQNSNLFAICRNKAAIETALKNNKIALVFSAEGPMLFHGQVDLLKNFYRLGIKIVNLTHGEGTEGLDKNAQLVFPHLKESAAKFALQISPSASDYFDAITRKNFRQQEKGLSEVGKTMLAAMHKLNIICDLSHANDAAFWEIIETTSNKICATHSNCAALCGHSRNLTDDMMRALAKRNGVMGLVFYGRFIDENKPSLERYVQHILHALEIMGPNNVGIGTDYDGVEPGAFMAIDKPGKMNELWEALDKAGVNHNTMLKIAHENFLRLID